MNRNEFNKKKLLVCLCLLSFVLFGIAGFDKPSCAYSKGSNNSTISVNSCMDMASVRYGVSYWIIYAIAKAESDFSPYALNIDGKSYFPRSFGSADRLINMNLKNNFDIGLMQINKYWFDRFHYPYYYGLVPCFDIMFGAWIISRKIDSFGYNWYGISAYHSATPSLNNKYAVKLYSELKHVEQIK